MRGSHRQFSLLHNSGIPVLGPMQRRSGSNTSLCNWSPLFRQAPWRIALACLWKGPLHVILVFVYVGIYNIIMKNPQRGQLQIGFRSGALEGGRSQYCKACQVWQMQSGLPGAAEVGSSLKMSSKAMATETKLKVESAHSSVVLIMARVTEVQIAAVTQRLP